MGIVVRSQRLGRKAGIQARAVEYNINNQFRPTSVGGGTIRQWLRADQGVTIATGVSQWRDLSGNNNHALQATGAKQPAFVASAKNGKPGVAGDGVDDSMTAAFTLTQPEHVWVVAKWNVAPAAFEDLFDAPNGNDMRSYRENVGQIVHIVGNNGAADFPATVATTTNFHIYDYEFNGASSGFRQDGNVMVTGQNIPTTAAGGTTLFTFGDGVSNPANATICEFIVYASVLNAADKATLLAYLRLRYAI
jgi:hypothetical protein